jgi:YesN/AraC family two-component response regulator
MLRLFHELFRITEYENVFRDKNNNDYITFRQIDQFVDKNLPTVNLDVLQKTFHYQRDYYSRIYKRHTGMTFIKFLEIKKIKKASELLITIEANCDQIMSMVGYQNKAHFYRLFNEYFGTSPNQYRKNMTALHDGIIFESKS